MHLEATENCHLRPGMILLVLQLYSCCSYYFIHCFVTVMRAGFVLTPEVVIALEKHQDHVAEAVMQKARDICSGTPVRFLYILYQFNGFLRKKT